jgi:hypothetical protein
MRSSTDSFWNAVEYWYSTNPKPRIRVEGADTNWPALLQTGIVDGFVRGESIDFIWEGALEPCTLVLSRCVLRAIDIPRSVEEADVVRHFALLCDEPDDATTRFVFTELRDFGKSN